MTKTNGQRRRPTTGAKTFRPIMVRNAGAADGFFRADAPKPNKRQGPDRGAMAAEVFA